ncbi:MAG: hypothetical protein DRG50_09795 [Deltaproteobacteria bacterium]|nr:MAG: hypothetical protein DRG50_09795 [Deltaproteobacteria bacterium]
MDWPKYAEELNSYIRMTQFPIGFKLCKSRDEIPKGARRPRFRINVCQLGLYARAYGWTMAATWEEQNCVLGACCCGLIPTPERVSKGVLGAGVYQKDLEAAAAMQKEMPKLDPIYDAIVAFPLHSATDGLEPDVIILYVNSAQCLRLIQASLWHEGGAFTSPSVGDAGMCSMGIAYVMKTQGIAKDVPCMGDRRFAGAQEGDIIFSFHKSRAQQILEGLEGTHKGGIRYPIPTYLSEAAMPFNYFTEVGDLLAKKK